MESNFVYTLGSRPINKNKEGDGEPVERYNSFGDWANQVCHEISFKEFVSPN